MNFDDNLLKCFTNIQQNEIQRSCTAVCYWFREGTNVVQGLQCNVPLDLRNWTALL